MKTVAGRVSAAVALAVGLVTGVPPLAAEPAPPAEARLGELSALLSRSDGATDDALIVAALDELRAMGPRAAPVAETLGRLLRHQSALYQDRDKSLVVRLRGYLLVTLSEIGFPASAEPALWDVLAHVDERMVAMELGAAARAVASLGPRGCALAPHLIAVLSARLSEEEFSLERYGPRFPPLEATTVQLEAVRSLGRVCRYEDPEVIAALRRLLDEPEGALDPRVVREARRALQLIGGRR